MRMQSGGIDIFYIDESHDKQFYVVTAVAIPFLRPVDSGWDIVWPDIFANAKTWRKNIKTNLKIPTDKELHGNKLASGHGHYYHGKWNFSLPKSKSTYQSILSSISFLPEDSIISVSGKRSASLYGHKRLEAVMYGLFQRMRKQCCARKTNGLVFFDQGHPEYRKLYRKAQRFLQTGSALGAWESGSSAKNMPLDMFTKDGNEKNSRHCYYTQLADIIAYAAYLKIKGENSSLLPWQKQHGFETLYDNIPSSIINCRASNAQPKDGIVRL